MEFDINQLDELEYDGSSESGDALTQYQNSVLDEFALSLEGKELIKVDPEIGFWIAQLIYYGFCYIGVSLSQMEEQDIDEIITGLFPEKITLIDPDNANKAIPELLAFWQFLERKYKLSNAQMVISYLTRIKPKFTDIMNDPSNFGLSKSFITMGQQAGFDMTDQEQMDEFTKIYNESKMKGQSNILSERNDFNFVPEYQLSKKAKAKKKLKRKNAKASRRKNRKKRKH
ncbi:MAG: hypothetical protein CSA18_04475 [Deltaproteobacteria bacterium]|nr:MAG: hypothetical protein CSA18_04475 [Deltaproteobacteria bacterium]